MGRLIEANALLSEMEKYSDDTASSKNDYLFGMQQRLETCIELVEDAPTVDAVPVVRCRDCKHWRKYTDEQFGECMTTIRDTKVTRSDDYCSYGAREDGDDEQTKKPE